MRQYNETTTQLGTTIISYEENGVVTSFTTDPSNSDYQRYLAWLENPEAEQSTPSV